MENNINIAKKSHYINNSDFCAALVEYKAAVERAKRENLPKPVIPNYIGHCFIKIAEGLSHKPNFINYTYREEMISDGIENCIMYFENFDPTKSSNAFAYFTQIIYYAFLRRIQKEKKQMEIRAKIIERCGYDEVFTIDGDGFDASEYNSIKDAIQTKMNQ